LKFSLTLSDASLPRALFYDRFVDSLRRDRRFVEDEAAADILFPHEDVALESNWPRYGNQVSAYIRGKYDDAAYMRYMDVLFQAQRPLCIVNMHPFIRIPLATTGNRNIIVADISLAEWERSLNPRTISMPVLAVTDGRGKTKQKDILASFRGVGSHPCRAALARLHNGQSLIFEIVPPGGHVGRIDAITGQIDRAYADLMSRSVFAVIPRGDAMFSYRLTEALSFGCVPVILSDGWVLPLDRSIDWHSISVQIPQGEVASLPTVLGHFDADRVKEMQFAVAEIYRTHFSGTDAMANALLNEIEEWFDHFYRRTQDSAGGYRVQKT
jgi:hypothetical protein